MKYNNQNVMNFISKREIGIFSKSFVIFNENFDLSEK